MIDKDMSIEDAVRRFPQSVHIFEKHGLGCVGCRAALFETIGQGAKIHGIDVDALITDLNKAIPRG